MHFFYMWPETLSFRCLLLYAHTDAHSTYFTFPFSLLFRRCWARAFAFTPSTAALPVMSPSSANLRRPLCSPCLSINSRRYAGLFRSSTVS